MLATAESPRRFVTCFLHISVVKSSHLGFFNLQAGDASEKHTVDIE